jgi:hypothetical protein
MPTESGLKIQLKRLAGYYGYQDVKFELLRVLGKHAASDEHAERIVTLILDTRRPNENGFLTCPTPAELIDYAAQVPSTTGQMRLPDRNCTMCLGSGWRVVERKGISGADRCPCTKQ